jgi:hypothetical protein
LQFFGHQSESNSNQSKPAASELNFFIQFDTRREGHQAKRLAFKVSH